MLTRMGLEFIAWLEGLAPIRAVATSLILYPIVNGAHILMFAVMLGAIAAYNIAAFRRGTTNELASATLPLARIAFVLAAMTGLVLFATRASHYSGNPAMQVKVIFLVVALANVALVHHARSPTTRRWTAAVSLASWSGVLFAGRWIAFA